MEKPGAGCEDTEIARDWGKDSHWRPVLPEHHPSDGSDHLGEHQFRELPGCSVSVAAMLTYPQFVEKVDWLRDFRDSSSIWKGLFAVIGGILPPAVAALCGYLLPYAVRWLDRWSGALTRGQLDKSVIRQMFVFLLVSLAP